MSSERQGPCADEPLAVQRANCQHPFTLPGTFSAPHTAKREKNVQSAMAKGTFRMCASVLAISVFPQPVGPSSRMLLCAGARERNKEKSEHMKKGHLSKFSYPSSLFIHSFILRHLIEADALWVGVWGQVRMQPLVVVVHGDRQEALRQGKRE